MDEICKLCVNEYPNVECINYGEKHYNFVAKDYPKTNDLIINNVEEYCCKDMQDNGWYIERKDNKINLQEEYSAHFVENIIICPWCGKKL